MNVKVKQVRMLMDGSNIEVYRIQDDEVWDYINKKVWWLTWSNGINSDLRLQEVTINEVLFVKCVVTLEDGRVTNIPVRDIYINIPK